ncbi:hypothetical protein BROSI_A1907 [Candidatus Brocadia sinica JPN1]|uniref:Uncharacterized protein n=1 Tax=Candidatus Brocadia sinica JPN1 TaxID=1197129 RepID=A0ABQ0JXB2_9BACT|nr:hypothetical protein BROSI_A1907 [Candidatus Brocadia sinica JPN1]
MATQRLIKMTEVEETKERFYEIFVYGIDKRGLKA